MRNSNHIMLQSQEPRPTGSRLSTLRLRGGSSRADVDLDFDFPFLSRSSNFFSSFFDNFRGRGEVSPIRRAKMAPYEVNHSSLKAMSSRLFPSHSSKYSDITASNSRSIPIEIIHWDKYARPLGKAKHGSNEDSEFANCVIEIEDDESCAISNRTVNLGRKSLLRQKDLPSKSKSQNQKQSEEGSHSIDTDDVCIIEASSSNDRLKSTPMKSIVESTSTSVSNGIHSKKVKENLIGGANKCHLPPGDDAILVLDGINLKSPPSSSSEVQSHKDLLAQSRVVEDSSEESEVNLAPAYPVYEALKEKLAKECRQIDYIRGDGNCFFRAISKQLYGSERFHKTIRNLIVDLIATNKNSFAQFVDGEDTQEHVERMCQEQSWATTCEIYAASTLLQRDIYMLTPDHLNETYSWLLFKPVFENDTQESAVGSHPCYLTLCNTNGNHYDRIVPVHGPCNCFLPHPELDGVNDSMDLTQDS